MSKFKRFLINWAVICGIVIGIGVCASVFLGWAILIGLYPTIMIPITLIAIAGVIAGVVTAEEKYD